MVANYLALYLFRENGERLLISLLVVIDTDHKMELKIQSTSNDHQATFVKSFIIVNSSYICLQICHAYFGGIQGKSKRQLGANIRLTGQCCKTNLCNKNGIQIITTPSTGR